MKTQKKTKIFSALILSAMLTMLIFTTGCKEQIKTEGLWQNAVYTEDKTFGSGKTTIYVEVQAEAQQVLFAVNTDKEILSDVLLEFSLVEGDNSEYGLYIKKVNGIRADYDLDKAYWGLFKNGSMLMTGASDTKISNGDKYAFIYSK